MEKVESVSVFLKKISRYFFLLFSFVLISYSAKSADDMDLAHAKIIAQNYLDLKDGGHHFRLIPESERHYPFGWVFAAAPKKYLESHDFRDIVPGQGPLIVENNGVVTSLSTSASPETVIETFYNDWKQRTRR